MALEPEQSEHPATPPTPPTAPAGGDDGSNNHQLLIGALIVAGVIIAVLLMLLFGAGNPGRGGETSGPGAPGAIVTVPAPNPDQAQITVTAADGVNVRSGPGTQYDVVGIMPFGTQAPVIGRSQDGGWWVINVPVTRNNQGWVAAEFVAATNVADVPVVMPPGEVPQPGPVIAFTAEPTTIQSGQCTTLQWQVENVSEVYVYPAGASWADYPAAGVGTRSECPTETTTYEMRVVMRDGAVDTRQVTVTVSAAQVDPLAGSRWRLAAMQVNQVPIPETTIDLVFDLANGAAGSAGCNNYSGAYRVDGSAVSFGAMVSTMKSCGDAIDQQEQLYLALLQAATQFELGENTLTFFDGGGQEILRYSTPARDQ
ncbi:MAG: META domain-containing protein [Caldilineaceae bacterium]|nr:META domain-containing protein [Caldilineaceae bacterium]